MARAPPLFGHGWEFKNLVDPPALPLSWIPSRFIWWWQASRVIQDYDLAHNFREIIDEFPAFSYLLGDLHPHVLAMPFDLLMVAVALNLFLGGWKGQTNLRFYRLSIGLSGLFFGGLLVGGLAFLNTWDILLGFALLAGAYVLSRAVENGWTWERLRRTSLPSVCQWDSWQSFSTCHSTLASNPQAGGILPNLDSPTRGVQLWVMFAPLFLALLAYLVYLWRMEKRPANWTLGFGLAAGLIVLLWLFSWALAFLIMWLRPVLAASFLDSECSGSVALCFTLTSMRRLSYLGGLFTLFGLLGIALAFIIKVGNRKSETEQSLSSSLVGQPSPFILLLIILGTVLVIAPEFVFLLDLFVNRMNTIFKFYYQAWLMWSMVAAFSVAVLLQKLRRAWAWVFVDPCWCWFLSWR